jgi:hypothetical protein
LSLGDLTKSWALDLKGTQIMHFDFADVSGAALAGKYDPLSPMRSRESGTVTGHMTFAAKKNLATTFGKSVNPSATTGAWVGKATQNSYT